MFLVLNFVCYHIFSCFLYGNTWFLITTFYLQKFLVIFFFFFFFFSFWTGNSIYWWAWLKREQSWCSWVQGLPFVQGTTIRDVLTPQPSGMSRFSATMFSNSSALNLVNPHFLEMWIFWRPGNLNLARRRASITCSLFCSLVRMDIMTWPMWTLATVPWGFPKAPCIPVWSRLGTSRPVMNAH